MKMLQTTGKAIKPLCSTYKASGLTVPAYSRSKTVCEQKLVLYSTTMNNLVINGGKSLGKDFTANSSLLKLISAGD